MKAKITQVRILFYSTITVGILLVLISLLLGDTRDPGYFWASLGAVPLATLAIYLHIRWKELKTRKFLHDNWGKAVQRQRDFEEISLFFRNSPTASTHVDDKTWADLNMNAIFADIDRTFTNQGEAELYNILRTPCAPDGAQELQYRNQAIQMLRQHPVQREKLQMKLHKLGRDDFNKITHLLWEPLPDRSPWAFIYTVLALGAVAAIVTLPFTGTKGIFWIILSFSLNSFVHYRTNKTYTHHIPAITSLAGMLKSGRSLALLNIQGLETEQKQLQQKTRLTRKILAKTRFLFPDETTSDALFLIQYIKILFLAEVRSFYGVVEDISRHRKELQEIYQLIGRMDVFQSVASYREGLEYVEPNFTSLPCLKVRNVRHPLLKDPVSNSITIQDQGILITGSNMAGKSTFLRTLGVTAIMAQSIYTCLADQYTASYLQVVSSIDKADDISQQKSLYYAEAERLLHILRPEYSQLPGLCLIDELLSGTNYTERLAASEAILNYLKKKNVLVVVATHDMDLADKLQDTYQCYHFSDKVDKNNLSFDYKLKAGIATTRNAIKLLEHLGYPRDIILQANPPKEQTDY